MFIDDLMKGLSNEFSKKKLTAEKQAEIKNKIILILLKNGSSAGAKDEINELLRAEKLTYEIQTIDIRKEDGYHYVKIEIIQGPGFPSIIIEIKITPPTTAFGSLEQIPPEK